MEAPTLEDVLAAAFRGAPAENERMAAEIRAEGREAEVIAILDSPPSPGDW